MSPSEVSSSDASLTNRRSQTDSYAEFAWRRGRSILNVSIPGIERSIAQGLVEDAEGICLYSKATSGNIAVSYNLV